MTSVNQDNDFIKRIVLPSISSDLLGDAISWINTNLSPEDVFDKKFLDEWAEEEGYVKNGQTP